VTDIYRVLPCRYSDETGLAPIILQIAHCSALPVTSSPSQYFVFYSMRSKSHQFFLSCVSRNDHCHSSRRNCDTARSSEFVGGLEARGSRTHSLYANSHESTSKRVFSCGWQAALTIMPLLKLYYLSTPTAQPATGMDLQ
jgi:hypothetical protein